MRKAEKTMEKRKKWVSGMKLVFIFLLIIFFCLGKEAAFVELEKTVECDFDSNAVYAIMKKKGDQYRLIKNALNGSGRKSIVIPSKEGEYSYQINRIVAGGEGQAVIAASVYKEEKFVGDKLWLWETEKGTFSEWKFFTYERGEEPIELLHQNNGVMIVQFQYIEEREDGSAEYQVSRRSFTGEGLKQEKELASLPVYSKTTLGYECSADQGIWYTDRYGNGYHSREDGTIEQVFKNDGSLISINNVNMFPSNKGIGFYNFDTKTQYWIGESETLETADWPWLTNVQQRGWNISSVIWEDDSVILYLEDVEKLVSGAVITPEGETVVFKGISLPYKTWIPYVVIAAGVITALFGGIGYLILWGSRHIRVIPVVCKVFAILIPIYIVGGAYVMKKGEQIFYERRLDAGENLLVNGVRTEAKEIESWRFAEEQFDVNYFENQTYTNEKESWNIQKKIPGRLKKLFIPIQYGYFREMEGELYPILEMDYVTTPARFVVSEEELTLLQQALKEKKIVRGTYKERGKEYRAAFAPVFDDSESVTGIVKASFPMETLKLQARQKAWELTLPVMKGFFTIGAAALLLIYISLRPLQELKRFIQELEENKEQEKIKVKGHNEISELILIVLRMSENIRGYIKKVTALQKKYEPFVPCELVELMGKEDIRQIQAGTQTEISAIMVILELDLFEKGREEMEPTQLFKQINEGMEILIPSIRNAGGQIVRFYRGGVIALFPEQNTAAAGHVLTMLHRLNEEKRLVYHGAMDYRKVTLEVTGCEERMDFTIKAEDWKNLFTLLKVGGKYGFKMTVTKVLKDRESIAELGETGKQQVYTRFVGQIKRKSDQEIIEFYELLNPEDDQYWLKAESASMFSRGISFFQQSSWQQGLELFANILRKNREDMAARRYFWLCDQKYKYFEEV